MKKVLALSAGLNSPSSRFRVRQLISPLNEHGIDVTESIRPLTDKYSESLSINALYSSIALASRIPQVFRSYSYDLTFFQRPLMPTVKTLESFFKGPKVLDIDDAIFLSTRNGGATRDIAKCVDLVIAGNSFLAGYCEKYNLNTIVVPTAIDVDKYCSSGNVVSNDSVVIGWIGTRFNLPYLYQIEKYISIVLDSRPNVILRVISNERPVFKFLSESQFEYIEWSAQTEVTAIQGFSIGLMPLLDTDWEKGKCSFKMLQYMSCEIPVAVSPVGMNKEVLSLGECGLSVADSDEWVDVLKLLIDSPDIRARYGKIGRHIVKRYYSLSEVAGIISKEMKYLL